MADSTMADSSSRPAETMSPPLPAAPATPATPESITLPPSHWLATPMDAGSSVRSGSSGLAFSWDDYMDSKSITSSILSYRHLHGRTYHAEVGNASYFAPNDEQAAECLDVMHHGMTLIMGDRMFLAPLDEATCKTVLDIGTGTGSWAIDFADMFPDCEVIGTDISPIQPAWVPPNLKFEIEDCTQTWTFRDNSFDYVHIRMLYGAIPDWEFLFREAYRVLKPGGWLESHEMSPCFKSDDGTLRPTHALYQWGRFFLEGGIFTGRAADVLDQGIQQANFEALGMEEIHVNNFKVPLGPWAKDEHMREIGRYSTLIAEDAEGLLTFYADMLAGWNANDIKAFCAHFRSEMRNSKIHAYCPQRGVYGRKPLGASRGGTPASVGDPPPASARGGTPASVRGGTPASVRGGTPASLNSPEPGRA